MRIACTSCNAVYELPAERVRPGRGVRCARCGEVWVPVETEDVAPEIRPAAEVPAVARAAVPVPEADPEPQEAEAPVPEPVAPVAVPPPAEVPASRFPVLLAWVLSLVVLGGMGWAAVHWRGAVMEAWPPSERAYRLLRLDGGGAARH